MSATAKEVLDVARSWIGYSEANGKFKEIIDTYNSHTPRARGYKLQYDDEWCDGFVSACAIKAGATDIIGTEVGCEKHVEIFKKKGIWIEDGTIKPLPGDIILFDWDDNTQPNDGRSNHIGYVEQQYGNTIVCIEGNKGRKVDRRTIEVGWGYIRGYARPKYDVDSTVKPKTQGVCNVELKVLKKGAKGDSVKALQTLLIGYGYSCGSTGVDGSFGGNTDKAVRAYQKANRLTVDGSVGSATWSKLLGVK